MATESWSSRVRHDSEPVWQEWRDELITKLGLLVTAGVLAADETNVTPGAGGLPSTNAEGGYAVFHLDDALHATAPVYIRFGFGTHSSQQPRIQVTTGTSTNGSGVLGGTALSTIGSINGASAQIGDTARQSYMCCVAGFFGLIWKVGSTNSEGGFFICRSCDADGAPTVTGSIAHWGNGTTNGFTKRQAFRYAATALAFTAVTISRQGLLGDLRMNLTSSQVGSDIQFAVGFFPTPRIEPIFGVVGVLVTELVAGGTFSATPVGVTPRTFLTGTLRSLANFGGMDTAAGDAGALNVAILWE